MRRRSRPTTRCKPCSMRWEVRGHDRRHRSANAASGPRARPARTPRGADAAGAGLPTPRESAHPRRRDRARPRPARPRQRGLGLQRRLPGPAEPTGAARQAPAWGELMARSLVPGRFNSAVVRTDPGELEARLSDGGHWQVKVRAVGEAEWRLLCVGDLGGQVLAPTPPEPPATINIGPL